MTTKTKSEKEILNRVENTVERITNTPVSDLRKRTLTEQRGVAEQKGRSKMKFVTRYPTIGRGNIIRERSISHADIEKMLDLELK